MRSAAPYTLPQEPGRWRALTLAAIVHALLFALLWFGVRWQNEAPTTVEAEIWSPQTKEAAPPPRQPTVIPKKAPEPEVKPIPHPTVEAPVVKPDINLEQDKKRKALEQEKVEQAKKEDADKKHQQEKAEQQRLAKMRAEDLQRMTALGGNNDAPKPPGNRSDPDYAQRLKTKIKSNTTFIVPAGLTGNPAVEYTVELFPDGSVKHIKKSKSSGLPGFDEAVENGIKLSAPYPADKSGTVPSSFNFTHKPKDQE